MFALARELAAEGKFVITTTTTKILEPLPSQTPLLLLERNEEKLTRLLLRHMGDYRHVTLVSEKLASGKLKGISPEMVVRLAALKHELYIVVEADGAASKPLKAPNPTEPVIPDNTSLVIPVVGIDALGCHLTEENVFRPEIVSRLLGLPLGAIISAESIATLLTHRDGIIKGSPERSRIIPFINKVEQTNGLAKGRDLAARVLAMKHPQIERVVLGQAQLPEPVVAVIDKEG